MTHRGGDSERRILQPGSALGEYTITERIGKGFFGRVYAAARTGSDQNHAIKVFRSEVTRRPGFAESLGEAVAPLQALKQTNIAAIHGFDTDRDACWIALDLAPGDGHGARTLQTLSDRFGGILEASTLTGILGGVLGGMAAAHAHGIVHGNLKPGNVLLYRLPDGRLAAKVMDFGWIRRVGPDWFIDRCRHAVKYSMKNRIPDDSRGDAFRALLQTREYMAPEMEKTGDGDFRSDVYAVGLMFYRLICGTRLSPRPPSHYNPALCREHDRFILRALEPDPADRYPDAGAMLEALEPVRELINRELEQKRRIEIGRKIGEIREKAAALVEDERFEEAREMLYALMQEHPGRQDVFEDFSALEDRIIEREAIANQEEQYHWDSMEARELEAAGNLKDALKVWTILARLFPHKEEAMDEVRRLMAEAGNAMEADPEENRETAADLDVTAAPDTETAHETESDHGFTPVGMERPSYENQGHTPMEQRRVDSKTPRVVRTARDRVEVYRRERNRAWDLADAGHFDEALAILTDLKEEYLDREELVTELELIEEETREAQQAARQAKRRRIFGYVIGGAAVLGILVLGYLWLG